MKLCILKKPVESAVTYYRAAGVFGPLSRCHKDVDVNIIATKDFTADVASGFDVVFSHRPVSSEEIRALWVASRSGCKIWVDIDDLLWAIPPSNPAALHFSHDHLRVLSDCVENAHIVSCSTQYLAGYIEKDFRRKPIVIPNAWNDYAQKIAEPNTPKDSNKILWRGSNTHDGDLFSYRDAFKHIEGVEYHFMGSQPWHLLESYGGHLNTIFVDSWTTNVLEYFDRIAQNKPNFVVVPLEDSSFNRAKSNIAQMEAIVAGALPITPDFPEFHRISSKLTFSNPSQLASIFHNLPSGDEFGELHAEAVKTIAALRLSEINQIRYQTLLHLWRL